MWMDIVLVIIFVLSLVDGLRRGFVKTAIDAFGWIIALVLAFVWYPSAAFYLKEHTGFYDWIFESISLKLSMSAESALQDVVSTLPSVIGDVISRAAADLASNLAASFANTIYNILCFVLVIFAIRIVLVLLASLITRGGRDNVVGALDRLAGFFAGAIKGIIVIYFFLAIATAFIGMSKGDFLTSSMEKAPLTKYMYEHNLIFLVVQDIL